MNMVLFLVILLVGLLTLVYGIYERQIPLILFASGVFFFMAAVLMFIGIDTNVASSSTTIATLIDSNTTQIDQNISYQTLTTSSDNGINLLAWSSLGIFFLSILSVFYFVNEGRSKPVKR